jgi:DUF971 family protein
MKSQSKKGIEMDICNELERDIRVSVMYTGINMAKLAISDGYDRGYYDAFHNFGFCKDKFMKEYIEKLTAMLKVK